MAHTQIEMMAMDAIRQIPVELKRVANALEKLVILLDDEEEKEDTP